MECAPTGKLSQILGLDDVQDPVATLIRLSPILELLDARLLLVIEDAERASSEIDPRPLERLLWSLRDVPRITFVLSMDPRAGYDYSKLCDTIERVPLITADRVEDLLAPAYVKWRNGGYIDPAINRTDRLGLDSVTTPLVRYFRRTRGNSVADAITALLNSPRKLKHFLRDVDRAWKNLRGEVELDDLIALTALRHAAPEAFDFIIQNAEAARVERPRKKDPLEGEAVRTVETRWKALLDTLPFPAEVQILTDVLGLKQIASERAISGEASQGVRHGEPVDYLARILAGEVLPGEVRDQTVLQDVKAWQESGAPAMFDKLVANTDGDSSYVKVWEHHAGRLSGEELVVIAGTLIDRFLRQSKADAAMEAPAMLAVWRRCNRRVERDSITEWLTSKIDQVIPVSVGFGTDLFQFWASVPHGVTSEQHRARVRQALVIRAKQSFASAASLLAALGKSHEYPLTRLVYPPPTDEPRDTIELAEWGWLIGLCLEAAATNEERIVPDLAVLFGDTSAGMRSGSFERQYRLKRDWLTKICGARTGEIVALLARYAGAHEHAKAAKVEAEEWLQEKPALRTEQGTV